MESAQNPYSMVSVTIRQLNNGNSIGFDIFEYMHSMFKNFITFSLSMFVIRGSNLIWSRVMLANLACTAESSLRTRGG